MMDDIGELAGHVDIMFNITPEREDESRTHYNNPYPRPPFRNTKLIRQQMNIYERQKQIITEKNLTHHDLIEILDPENSKSIQIWLDLQLEIERLTDWFENNTRVFDNEIKALNIKPLQSPDKDACQFVSNAFGAAIVTCGVRIP